ncbi:MAG: MFS transporter [Synechococcus sp.]|nr:MFS transporter [Synechococcus sp.]
MAEVRALAALGAGGILFLGPLVFNRIGLDAALIGQGLALASGMGLITRFLSGYVLDRGVGLAVPLRIGALLSICGDLALLRAHGAHGFLLGELLLGLGMGSYWPAAELASAKLSDPLPSSEGFALARTADALGIALGALLGTAMAALLGADQLRLVYGVDLGCMVLLLQRVGRLPQLQGVEAGAIEANQGHNDTNSGERTWLQPLLPLLLLALLCTGLIVLQQSALPLDLARGGLARGGIAEVGGGLLMGVQLGLVLLLQWPVGHWLGQHPVGKGLRLSLGSFAGACALLALSALHPGGLVLLLLAQGLLALAITAFLPTITEAVVEAVAAQHQGVALGLYSQVWAISGMALPPLAGLALEREGHGMGLWLVMAGLSLLAMPLAPQAAPASRS